MLMRMRSTVALAVALAGATAFTPPPLFGPPRTRAAALAYAKKAVYKKADKDQQPETTQVHHQVQPHKGPRHSRWSGRVEMSIDPSCVPGTPILRNQKIMRLPLSLTGRHAAGSVVAPDYLLPLAAATCYSIPVMILFLSGDMDKDRFKRSHTGLTLKQRAVDDFQRGLTRALQRVGVLAEPRPTTARSELGCDPAPRPRSAASSVSHLRLARSQAEKQSGRHHDARCRQGRRRAARLGLHHVRGYGGLRPVALRGRQYVCLQRPALGVRLSSER